MVDDKKFDRAVGRTARRFATELERLCADLHQDDFLSTAFGCVLAEIKKRHPDLMPCLMLGMADFLAEMQRHSESRVPTHTAEGATIH